MIFINSTILVQTPAPVYNIKVSPSNTTAHVSWSIKTSPMDSSYITRFLLYVNRIHRATLNRTKDGTEYTLTNLKPYTTYRVTIWAGDGSFKTSSGTFENFMTTEAGKTKNEAIYSLLYCRLITTIRTAKNQKCGSCAVFLP